MCVLEKNSFDIQFLFYIKCRIYFISVFLFGIENELNSSTQRKGPQSVYLPPGSVVTLNIFKVHDVKNFMFFLRRSEFVNMAGNIH